MGGKRRNAARGASRPPFAAPPAAGGGEASPRWWRAGLELAALVALVATAYAPAWHGGLLWDDAAHLTAPALRSLDGLRRIWTELGATQQYYPLTHSAFWLQARLWGDAVAGYHLASLALHATSALLVLRLLRRLAVPGAPLAALAFALHPVHVESVAWISELKNTLSTPLCLASALAYLGFDEGRRRRDLALALGLFLAALAAKTVTATLPAALLVVLWWRRGRLEARRDVLPLAPFLAAGTAAGLLTAWVERTVIGAEGAEFALGPAERVELAGRAFWFHLGKLVWPSGLVFVYPRWELGTASASGVLAPLALLALAGAAWAIRSRSRAPLAALLLYLAGLFPALGFFDVFPFRYSYVADHFQYLASIPALAALAAALAVAARRLELRATVAAALGAALVVPLAVLTSRHAASFVSSEALYRSTLERNPAAWLAHNNLGLVLAERGRLAEARAHFEAARRLAPAVAEHHMNLGRLAIAEGSLDEAVRHLAEAARLDPGAANARSNLGVARLRQGRLDEAVSSLEEALRLAPAHPEATASLAAARQQQGVALARAGRLEDALDRFRQATRLAPDDPDAHYNLGTTLLALRRPAEAVAPLEAALRLRPGFPQARANLDAARR